MGQNGWQLVAWVPRAQVKLPSYLLGRHKGVGGHQMPAMAPGPSQRRCPGQALGISGEKEVTIWGQGETRGGRLSQNWVRGRGCRLAGLHQIKCRACSPSSENLALSPADPISCLSLIREWGGVGLLLGLPLLLPHSWQESGVKRGEFRAPPQHPKPLLLQPPIVRPPGPGWADSGSENWKLGLSPCYLCSWHRDDAR